MMTTCEHIILISGKRKCGKDYLAERLEKRLGERSQIIRISEPIKKEWSKKEEIDLLQLLSDGPLKEQYRKQMIEWSDKIRQMDSGYFCKAAMLNANKKIVIVSDVRRKNDIKYFKENYGKKTLTIRVTCPDAIREKRNWIYTEGVDDVESECGLDDYEEWDMIVENNGELKGEQIVDLIITKFGL